MDSKSHLKYLKKKKRGGGRKVGEKWCANVIGLDTSEVLTRCGCVQINKLLSSRRSQSIKLHITQNLRRGCQSTPWFFTEWVAEEERGFVPALIWHGVESKVKARRAALHLTAWGEVGKLFLQKPREHIEKQWEQWHPIRGLTGQLHYLLMRVTTQGRELHGRRKMLETGVTFFFFATTTCLFAKRDNAHGAILS